MIREGASAAGAASAPHFGARPWFTEATPPAPVLHREAPYDPSDLEAGSPYPMSIGPYVDIFLSSGPMETDGPSCEPGDQGNCGLYRLRWDLGAERRVGAVEQIASASRYGDQAIGHVEAAVRASDGALVWLMRGYQPSSKQVQWVEAGGVWLVYSDGKGISVLDSGHHGPDRPQWPWFYSDSVVMFEKAQAKDWRDLWSVHTDGSHLHARTKATVIGLSIGNPQVGTGAATGMVVSFGIEAVGDDPNPHITDVDGNVIATFSVASDESFHHPAWNEAGDRIVAGRHRGIEKLDGRQQELLHFFGADSTGQWVDEGLAFNPLTYDKFPSDFVDVTADSVTYKYPHWCGDDRHLVATVYTRADGEGSDDRPRISRVLLIRLPDTPGGVPEYYDLTREVARAFPMLGAHKDWRGVFSVCRAVEG